MDRIIEVRVGGNHLSKDNKNAGVKGEANVTMLRITFDEGWDKYAKTVTFWDAQGNNPVKRIQGADLIEDITKDARTYLTPIPKEPLAIAGEMTFVIDGYLDGKRQRSIEGKLLVKDALETDNAGEPTDPTPTQAEQLQVQIDAIIGNIQNAQTGAEAARDEARVAETNAKNSAGEAGQFAKAAQNHSESAKSYANTANTHASTSKAYADTANTHANTAKAYADDSEDSANKAKEAISYNPRIIDGYWYVWSTKEARYVATGVKAQSGSTVYYGDNPPPEADVWINPDGESAIYAPYIGENGNWYVFNCETQSFTDSGCKAYGEVGEKYKVNGEKQGEIFSDYENNKAISKNTTAFGSNTLAGCRCYYFYDIQFKSDSAIITLQKEQARRSSKPSAFAVGWEVNDVISMVNNSKYWDCATITAINNNVITVTKLPFSSITHPSDGIGYDDYAIFVAEKPEEGTGCVGECAIATGVDSRAIGRASFTNGRENVTKAQYGFTSGKNNKSIGYSSFVTGQSNTVTGDSGAAFGSNNQVKSTRAFAAGFRNTAEGGNAFVGGHTCQAVGNETTVFGYGNKAYGPRSTIIGCANTIAEAGENGFASGLENKVMKLNGAAFGRGNTTYNENAVTFGQFADTSENDSYLVVVGNGTSHSNKANAHTLDTDGNAWFGGKVFIGGNSQGEGVELIDKQTYARDMKSKADKATTLEGYGITDAFSKTEAGNMVSALQGRVGNLESDVEGLQLQIYYAAHFKGYLTTNAKIQALEATPNDFAYSAESGTVWIYAEITEWEDTGVPVPDQLTPASDATPLINGEATAGTANEYARGDHRHPTDTTRASAEELSNLKISIETALDNIIAIQNLLIGGDAE